MKKFYELGLDGSSNPSAIVTCGNARFTILTSRLIRLEYDPAKKFEDRPSNIIWNRQFSEVPEFSVEKYQENGIMINTEHLTLTYTGEGFKLGEENLRIKGADVEEWYPDMHDTRNLMGTISTLDGSTGSVELEKGLMSGAGWTVIDDTKGLIINEKGWIEPRYLENDSNAFATQDIYFFGYGHNYRQCLRDYKVLTGKTELFPRYVLGNWWSRYHDYTQKDLQDIVNDFKDHKIPLSICIIDMDWHTIKNEYHDGWTGYSWNKDLIENPMGLLDFFKDNKVRTALNLHPHSGFAPHEDCYEAVAKAMGVDPESKQTIEFDITDEKFMNVYFEEGHHPHEETGVDFWWMDWQQGSKSKMPGLPPLRWLNHLHYYDLGRDGVKRPFIFSRYCQLGSHRYPIGFSGDTCILWDVLEFQVYFTHNAANVGYGWWSHDIGGHMGGYNDSELYTRWVQFGVWSPIMRLHSTKHKFIEKRPWMHDKNTEFAVTEAMRYRVRLVPYIYTMMYRDYVDSQPLMVPMYYDYPELAKAYNVKNQYLFGTELLVAPFVKPMDQSVNLSRTEVWFPEGSWFNFFTGEKHEGEKVIAEYGDFNTIPVFAKAGAIVPLGKEVDWEGMENPDELEIKIFGGADGKFELYEDDGETVGYKDGKCAFTSFESEYAENRLKFTINPAQGDRSVIPEKRKYVVKFMGANSAVAVKCTIDGIEVAANSRYIEDECAVVVLLDDVSCASKVEVVFTADKVLSDVNFVARKLEYTMTKMKIHYDAMSTLLGFGADYCELIQDPSKLWKIAGLCTGAQLQALAEIINN